MKTEEKLIKLLTKLEKTNLTLMMESEEISPTRRIASLRWVEHHNALDHIIELMRSGQTKKALAIISA